MKDTFKGCCDTLVGANCNSPSKEKQIALQRQTIRLPKEDNSPFIPPIETIRSGDSNES